MRSMQRQLGKAGTISAFALGPRETKKNLCRDGRSQDLPDTDLQPAVRHQSKSNLRRWSFQNQYTKPEAQIRTSDAEDVFEQLNYRDQEITLEDLVKIRKQSGLQEAEEPEPEPKESTTTGLRFTEGLELTEAGWLQGV